MLKLSPFRTSDEHIWDAYVSKANNGTFFHLRSFLNYHPKQRFKDHSIVIRKKGALFSLFPAVEQFADGKKILISHPGATVGSFVLPENLSIADAFHLANK